MTPSVPSGSPTAGVAPRARVRLAVLPAARPSPPPPGRGSGPRRQAREARSAAAGAGRPLPGVDAEPTAEPTGLCGFDLGSVPASVTPPRSWRRAAWLSGSVGGGVAVALLVLGAVLGGPGRQANRMDGLPGYPSEFRFPESRPATPTSRPGNPPNESGPTRDDTRTSEPEQRPTEPVMALAASPAHHHPVTEAAARNVTPTPAATTHAHPTSAPPRTTEPLGRRIPPKVTTVPNQGAAGTDPDKLRKTTVQFYEGVGRGLDGVTDLLADDLRRDGAALLNQQFGDVVGTRVEEIVIDPARGVTISVLRVEHRDGTVTTERRELRFAVAPRPLVSGERLLSRAQR
ncbi:hypothetical protein [Streptoalloteichus tenebrarius]|uniref:hypothetical protein n=1 Tax=Streptoalloteichus tenebrarius (strain ATCC 17920 / DSM 40477 / JCM 4838 / CBS 697.72 / NBRC 16177 / NCIMB 11028 / NRRL B-12390 / A12253. 1 / ISP 5477) TaxID=1933 RepID=UPI0020A37E70|nr:hypothetical protein [Streptoalloteichus tenebrarius]BFF02641.1 hypothetical protein GCM10020241_43160 [Streptoalloteichus tenebrarius]